MRIHESPRWRLPLSLLTAFFLLTAVPALAEASGSIHRDGHHQKSSSEGHEDHPHSAHHDGMQKGHGGHGHGSTHPGHHRDAIQFIKHILKFKDGMSLTAEQEQQLEDLKVTYKKGRITMKADVKLASIDLHEVLKNEKANLSDIEAEFNKLHALKTKLYMASIKAKRDAKAVLSEEQRTRMDKIHERIKSHGGNMEHSGDYSKYKKSKGHGTNGHRQ